MKDQNDRRNDDRWSGLGCSAICLEAVEAEPARKGIGCLRCRRNTMEVMSFRCWVTASGKTRVPRARFGRDVQAVHRDVTTLANAGVIDRTEKGVEFPYGNIHFEFDVSAAA